MLLRGLAPLSDVLNFVWGKASRAGYVVGARSVVLGFRLGVFAGFLLSAVGIFASLLLPDPDRSGIITGHPAEVGQVVYVRVGAFLVQPVRLAGKGGGSGRPHIGGTDLGKAGRAQNDPAGDGIPGTGG